MWVRVCVGEGAKRQTAVAGQRDAEIKRERKRSEEEPWRGFFFQ